MQLVLNSDADIVSGFWVGMAGNLSVHRALMGLGHEIKEADIEDGTGDGHVCSDRKQTNDPDNKSDGA